MATKMVDALPTNAKNAPSRKKGTGNFTLRLKPTEGDNVYRFRLLSFTTGTNTRDYPFIEKFVHEKWDKTPEGKGIFTAFCTCPGTRYVKPTLPQGKNPYDLCPICSYVNKNFIAYKESDYKDKIASKVIREHKRKYVALVPVFVVKDQHDPTNTNKPKVWVIKDKEVYDKLNSLIKKQQAKSKVFNDGPAVDLLIYVNKEDIIVGEGKPYQFTRTEIKIGKFGFGKNEYKIDAINDQLIEGFPFDDEFYTFTSPEELQKYYTDYVISSSNIPEDGIATDDLAEPAVTTATETPAETVTEDTITEVEEVTQEEIVDKDLSDIDDLINDAADKTEVVEEVKPAPPVKPATKPVETKKVETAKAKPVVETKKPVTKTKLTEPIPAKSEADDIDSMIEDVLGE